MHSSCQGDCAPPTEIYKYCPYTAQQQMHHFSLIYLRESARLLSNYAFGHFKFLLFPSVKFSSYPLKLLKFCIDIYKMIRNRMAISRKHCFVEGAQFHHI